MPSHTSQSTRERKGESRDRLEPASQKTSSFATWRKSDGSSWWEPAEGFNQVGSFEDARKDRCKRPTVAEQRQRPCYRHARIAPVLEAQIVSFKNQPERDGKHGEREKLSRLIVQTGMPTDRQYGRISEQDVACPGNRGEINCDWLEAPK